MPSFSYSSLYRNSSPFYSLEHCYISLSAKNLSINGIDLINEEAELYKESTFPYTGEYYHRYLDNEDGESRNKKFYANLTPIGLFEEDICIARAVTKESEGCEKEVDEFLTSNPFSALSQSSKIIEEGCLDRTCLKKTYRGYITTLSDPIFGKLPKLPYNSNSVRNIQKTSFRFSHTNIDTPPTGDAENNNLESEDFKRSHPFLIFKNFSGESFQISPDAENLEKERPITSERGIFFQIASSNFDLNSIDIFNYKPSSIPDGMNEFFYSQSSGTFLNQRLIIYCTNKGPQARQYKAVFLCTNEMNDNFFVNPFNQKTFKNNNFVSSKIPWRIPEIHEFPEEIVKFSEQIATGSNI